MVSEYFNIYKGRYYENVLYMNALVYMVSAFYQ